MGRKIYKVDGAARVIEKHRRWQPSDICQYPWVIPLRDLAGANHLGRDLVQVASLQHLRRGKSPSDIGQRSNSGDHALCHRFAPFTAVSANFSWRSKTQEHPRFAGIGYECNLKAVALKALSSRNPLCEKDSQGTAAGRVGEEYATPSGGAWSYPRGVGPGVRYPSDLPERAR